MLEPRTPTSAFVARRRALAARFAGPAVVASGLPRSRNYAANRYPFRASSHFLYFTGLRMPGAAVVFEGGLATLYAEPPDDADALWHGPRPTLDALRETHGFDRVRPVDELAGALATIGSSEVATLPASDAASAAWLGERLGRRVPAEGGLNLAAGSPDAALADAMIALRLRHDAAALEQLRAAARLSAEAHVAGMRATKGATTEAAVAAAMIAALRRHGLDDAYGPIVTVHGEVLHAEHHDGAIAPGELLLADVGGETPEGWAADITRTWPVSGTFSPTQRAIYDVVLRAQTAAIAEVAPGARYRAVHEAAGRALVEGLRELGIFQGSVDGLLERNAQALFFPHGIGHLLGLDVHDLEDLGDRAGYAPGRARSARFGERYLRLDRDLEVGMAVTIEPGFYQVPGILGSKALTDPLGADLDRGKLALYADVRGIRIEDDVLVTSGGAEVLTGGVPKAAADVERLVRGG